MRARPASKNALAWATKASDSSRSAVTTWSATAPSMSAQGSTANTMSLSPYRRVLRRTGKKEKRGGRLLISSATPVLGGGRTRHGVSMTHRRCDASVMTTLRGMADRVALVLGARASWAAPAGRPLFGTIAEALFDGVGVAVDRDRRWLMAPEALLSRLSDRGVDVDAELHGALGGQPNAAHYAAATVLAGRGAVWTTNFDELVEAAAAMSVPFHRVVPGDDPGMCVLARLCVQGPRHPERRAGNRPQRRGARAIACAVD